MADKRGSERSGDGVYPYETRAGTRYYFKYRKSDGRSATKGGFTSPRAARRERKRTIVSAALGEQLSTTETFGEWFDTCSPTAAPISSRVPTPTTRSTDADAVGMLLGSFGVCGADEAVRGATRRGSWWRTGCGCH